MGLSDEQDLEIEEAMNAEMDGEASLFEALSKSDASDTAKNGVVAGMRLLKRFGGAGVKELVAKAGLGHEAPKKTPKVPDPPKPEDAATTPETPPEFEVLFKAERDKHAAELATRDEKNATLEKRVGSLEDEKDDAVVRALIEDANLPGMATEDQFKLVKSMDEEQRKTFGLLAKGVGAHISLGDEIGTDRRGQPMVSAYAEALALANGLIEKSAGALDELKAMDAVWKANRGLYRRYKAEMRGGVT